MSPTVELRAEGAYGIITLNRPEALNALSFAILGEIEAAIDAAGAMDIRALIFTGAGDRAFCAGADVKELMGRTTLEELAGAEFGQRVFAKLDRFKTPSIAAINGYAFGGGFELAMACTFRVAALNAKVGLPEVKLGLVPGYGGTQRLPRLIGQARALDLILTGRSVGAEEAYSLGIFNRLTDGEVLTAAIRLADEFGGFSLPTLGLARAAVQRALDTPLSEGLKIEADLSTIAYRTEDAAEGVAAFVEKRSPRFQDR